MVFIIMFIFVMALFPGVFPSINLGVFYLTPLRLGLILLPLVILNKYNRQKNYKCVNILYSYNRLYIVFIIIWFCYSILNVLWVKSLSNWMHAEYFLVLFIYCTIFFTMGDIHRKDIVTIFKCICVVVFIHNIIGWYEIFFHHYFFAPIYKVEYMTTRHDYYAISAFYNLNDFAFVMLFGSFISYASFIFSKNRVMKIFSLITMVSSIAHVIRSDSRSCILALLLGWGVYLLITPGIRKKVYMIVWLTGITSFTILLMPHLLWQFERVISTKLNFSVHSNVMNSDMIRINLIRNGFEFLKQTSWFGVGSGNTEAWMASHAVYNTGGIINMHNWWMEIFTNYGIIIFSTYLIFYISLIVTFKKGVKILHGANRKLSAIIVSILCSFIVGLMSASSFFTTEWLWVFFALLVAAQRIERIDCKNTRINI